MGEQMHFTFDGIPDEEPCQYSQRAMARAFALLDEYEHLVSRYPGFETKAVSLARDEVMTNGTCGSRWLGEELRRVTRSTFTNDLCPVIARRAIAGEPLLAGYIATKPCPIDVAMNARGVEFSEN